VAPEEADLVVDQAMSWTRGSSPAVAASSIPGMNSAPRRANTLRKRSSLFSKKE